MDAVSVLVRVERRAEHAALCSAPRRSGLARATVGGACLAVQEVIVLAVGTCLLCAGLVARVLAEALPYAGQRVLAESRLLGRPR